MSAVATESQWRVNGLSSPSSVFNEAAEYEKILNIWQQISAGTHPRLKIPSQFVSSAPLPPLPSLANSASHVPASNALRQSLPGLESSGPAEARSTKIPPIDVPVISQTLQPRSGPSEIDPIFLQKSDHLIHAEMKIQRDRLEKQLREQLESKRIWSRQHPLPEDAKPDFDIAQTLSKACEVVKPIPSRDAGRNKTPSDTFDEDSFYSSKAPDSTPRGGDVIEESPRLGHEVQPIDIDEIDGDGLVDHRNDALHQPDHAVSSFRGNGINKPLVSKVVSAAPSAPQFTIRESDESDEEPEYFPPEPTQVVDTRRDSEAGVGNGHLGNRRQTYGRNIQRYENGRRYESPSADPRIVRNHITSPVAPKPSRISPLAMAKEPPPIQNRHSRHEPSYAHPPIEPESLRTSPDTIPAPMQSRKRRKIREDTRRERQNKKRRGAVSPEPVIKDEPVSPPPFHEVPPLGAARSQQATEPSYIEIDPPRESRFSPALERHIEYRQPQQVVYEVESPTRPREATSYPRTVMRESFRNDQDLRRVASMRNVRTEYPPERVQSVSREQSTHYAHERQSTPMDQYRPAGRHITYDESAPTFQGRLIRASSPMPQIGGDHLGEIRPNEGMAPPARRIVVDEDGNRFYETVQPTRAVPPSTLSGRLVEYERYSHGDSISNQVVRASSVFEDPYRERRYVQEMPPPQLTYRRVTEAPRTELRDRGLYSRDDGDRSTMVRSGSVQVVDYSPQQNTYLEERATPREEIVRLASVRPAPSHYDEPREIVQRVQSVRPGGREVSVFVEDRPQARREYIPIAPAEYEIRRDLHGGYYEIDQGGRMILDRPAEGRQSVAPRYY